MLKMAFTRKTNFLLLFLSLIFSSQVLQGVLGSRAQIVLSYAQKVYHISPERKLQLQVPSERWISTNSRRLMIGSVAPICTYNECRGCKYKCRAEQVPVEGNDPMNSAYHYKCVCHR
ncbi:hypothetical protein LguiA_020693 [Lonicera macranthoides]